MSWKNEDNNGVTQKEYWQQMWPHIKRFITFGGRWIHSWVNLYVEGGRISPYHHGHVCAYIVALHFGIILGLIFL